MVDVEIERESENKLLERRELTLKAEHEGENTPTRDNLLDNISDLVGASKDCIIIDSINPEFGKGESTITVRVYNDPEYVEKYERDHIIERNK